jgi:glucosamine--fructose-6-phosphate aminotransferase (isomerizing)
MCGIVGAIAQRNVANILLTGLKRLEYRGYDSAGVALLNDSGIQRVRRQGKVQGLEDAVNEISAAGVLGIAHTRWATHGVPSERNAHPHMSGSDIALVHNGIVENFQELRIELESEGYEFSSETDTEVIVHLVHRALRGGNDLCAAVRAAAENMHGAFALGVISKSEPNKLVAIRFGSPLVIGLGIDENYLASDQLALLPVTNRFIFLEEGDMAELTLSGVRITDKDSVEVTRAEHELDSVEDAEKGEYRHFMLKETFEQPAAIQRTLEGRIESEQALFDAFGENAKEMLAGVNNIQIIACGTSYHAGMVARYWLEGIAGVPCQVEVASEFRYRKHVVSPGTLFVTISQSGETADTLAALRGTLDSPNYCGRLAICNVDSSSLVRESELVFLTKAGPEIGVASTKAFTTQLTGLLLLVMAVARAKNTEGVDLESVFSQLRQLPGLIEQALQLDARIETLAEDFVEKHHTLFLGRGPLYPIAMEGALKLKEISYIHAEAYPAGELKHGPLALVDKDMPIVSVAPNDQLLEKLKSNLQEVRARGGVLYLFADRSAKVKEEDGVIVLGMPPVPELLVPIVYTIPMQLLSYHVAVARGTDVDQPRNLAKSVTVE